MVRLLKADGSSGQVGVLGNELIIAYVTLAHADEVSLVRNGVVLTTTPTTSFPPPVQHSPCWLTLVGPFMYASNSPNKSLSRYAVYGQKIVPDAAAAAG